jgi:DinB superfamily
MNPYASLLGNRDPLQVASETPALLRAIENRLGATGMEQTYAPGKWSARKIVCHLADCEVVFAFRFRQALAEADHVIQPFDQDAWARPYGSSALSGPMAIATFSALRQWNLALLTGVPQTDFSKPVTHPERGKMTFKVLLETMAGHDLNHLQQLDRIAAA